jgi:hypothetical protein
VTEDVLTVGCPWGGCGAVVPVQRFAAHALRCHRDDEQAGIACPICPLFDDNPEAYEDQANLLCHVHDVHLALFEPDVRRSLSAFASTAIQREFSDAAVSPFAIYPLPDATRGPEVPPAVPSNMYRASRLSTDLVGQECPICLERLLKDHEVARLECLCVFHRTCLDDWLAKKPSCPLHTTS